MAPTPSGFLHVGNACSFVLTWLLVRRTGGTLRLRIDDLDAARTRPEYLEDIFASLDWLGLDYDAGPSGPTEFTAHYAQRYRLPHYRALLDGWRARGLLFACDCSRAQVRRSSLTGAYPGTCRHRRLPFDQPGVAWRFRTKAAEPIRYRVWERGWQEVVWPTSLRDPVVRRKDGTPAYQVTSLVDDQHYGIDLVVRGEDLLDSTAAQVGLSGHALSGVALGAATFLHHPLLRAPDGQKLSKSAGAVALKAWRARGSPAPLYRLVAEWLGWPPVPNARALLSVGQDTPLAFRPVSATLPMP